MLVQLTHDLVRQLDEYTRQQNSEAQAADIERTKGNLKNLTTELSGLRDSCALLKDRLAPSVLERVANEVTRLRRDLNASQQRFLQNELYNQAEAVENVRATIKKQRDNLAQNWQTQVENHLQSCQARYRVIRFLPEIKEQEAQIVSLRKQLEDYGRKLPRSNMDLGHYDELYAQLNQILQKVDSLSENVQAFLTRVNDKKATLADLNPEVLTWCQANDCLPLFKIGFEE